MQIFPSDVPIDRQAGRRRERPFPGWPEGPAISHVPVRRIIRRASAISNGITRSYKHPDDDVAAIPAESDNELIFVMLAELDPCVDFVVSQPTTFAYTVDGRVREHTPDFALLRCGEAELHEVKTSRALEDATILSRLTAVQRHVSSWSDWSYLVTASTELRCHPLLANARRLWRHHRRCWTDLQRLAVLDLLRVSDRTAADVVASLSASSSDPPSVRQLLSLAAGCEIFIDLSVAPGEASLLRYPDPLALPPSLLPSRPPQEFAA